VRKVAQALFDPKQVAECFVCGPGTMIDDVAGALRECGVEPERIHGEHFTAGPAAGVGTSADEGPTTGATAALAGAAQPAGAPATAASPPSADVTEVTLVMDGRRRSFTMRRNAETVLDAAARAGLELPFSCRAGVCSTCRTKVVRGSVQMQENHALEEWELREGYVLACQSRATTPVLELDYDEK
jgi:ring-1,2-phenylacetyl-CoA epoxidase subunit PaaE